MKIITFILQLVFCLSINAQEINPFLKAMADAKKGNSLESIENFTLAIENNINIEKSYLYRGITYYQIREYSSALKDFTRIKDQNSTALLWIAKIFAIDNNPIISTQNLEKYLSLNTGNETEALKCKEFQQIHYSKEWQNLVDKNRTSLVDENMNEALYYLKNEEYKTGISNINKAISIHGNQEKLLLVRAKLYSASGNNQLAIKDYIKIIELNESCHEYKLKLAEAYACNNEDLKAAELFKIHLNNNPEDFEIYLKLTESQINNNQLTQAKSSIDIYLIYFNEDIKARYLLADIDYRQGNYLSSLKELNALLEKHTPEADWFLKRGLCYAKTNTYKYAAADLSMCLDLDPFNTVANIELGNVHQKLGNMQKACYYWQRALNAGELKATESLLEYCQ